MNKWLYALAAALLLAAPAHAQLIGSSSLNGGTVNTKIPDLSGCASYEPVFNHIWYVDPVNGFAQNDYTNGTNGAPLIPAIGGASGQGTTTHPWSSLQAAFTTQTGYPRPLLSTAQGGTGASPITPGDEILLNTGSGAQYGVINVGTSGFQINNSSFVTVAAAPGQSPVVQNINVVSATKLWFSGFKIQAAGAAHLLSIKDAVGFPTKDIHFDHMAINSVDTLVGLTTPSDIIAAFSTGGGFTTSVIDSGNTCGYVTNSHFSNMANMFSLVADKLVFSNNEMDHFTNDALDFNGNNQIMQGNNLHDRIDDGSGAHGDFLQGFLGRPEYHDVLVDRNIINYQKDPVLPFFLAAGTPITIASVSAPQTGITATCTVASTAVLNFTFTLSVDPVFQVGAIFEVNFASSGGTPTNPLVNGLLSVKSITGTGPFTVVGQQGYGFAVTCPTSISPGTVYAGNTVISSPTRVIGTGISFTQGATTFTMGAGVNSNGSYTVYPAATLTSGAATAVGNGHDFTGCIDQTDGHFNRLVITNNIVTCVAGGIEVASVSDSVESNNTVVGKLGTFTAAGAIFTSKNTLVIRDNLITAMGVLDASVTIDHNTIIGSSGFVGQIICNGALTNVQAPGTYCGNTVQNAAALTSVFNNYDPSTLTYDLTLKAGSTVAIGQGVATTPIAPRDFNDFVRVAPVDLGAYNQ